MRNKILRLMVSCFLLLILTSCKTDFSIDIYSSDMFFDENLDTPAKMKVEIPSCGQRSEYERKVLALFGTQSMAKIVGCEEEGMSSMLIVSLTAEIASAESDRDVVLFRQQEQDIEHDGRVYELRGVQPVIHQEFLQRVNSLMQENMQTLSYSDISIEFLLPDSQYKKLDRLSLSLISPEKQS